MGGDQEPGLEPGDIIIILDEKAHTLFKRNGSDLVMKMDISLTEALTGIHSRKEDLSSSSTSCSPTLLSLAWHRPSLEYCHLLRSLWFLMITMRKVMVMEDMALEYSAPLSKRIVAASSSYIQ